MSNKTENRAPLTAQNPDALTRDQIIEECAAVAERTDHPPWVGRCTDAAREIRKLKTGAP